MLSQPRLKLGFVKELISNLIRTLKNEVTSQNPLKSLETIGLGMEVPPNEYKPLIETIRQHVQTNIATADRSAMTDKFQRIMARILKKVEKDFK